MAENTASNEKRSYKLNCIEDALSLLNLLFGTDGGMTLTELYLASGVSKNKAFRLLTTFERNGVVVKNQQGKFGPGISALVAALKIVSRDEYVETVNIQMENIARQLDEAVYFASKIDGQAVLTDMVDCRQQVRARSFIGSVLREQSGENDAAAHEVAGGIIVTAGLLDPDITTIAIDIATVSGQVAGSAVWQTAQIMAGQVRPRTQPTLLQLVRKRVEERPVKMESKRLGIGGV